MMSEPKVSVVIPTFNRAACVGEAIDSVLAQTYREFEVILVDDGSTDDTASVLAKYGDQIRVIRQANGGVSRARNTGIEAARGECVATLDSYDVWLPEKLSIQMKCVAAYPDVIGVMVDARVTGYGEEASMFTVRGMRENFSRRPLRERPLLDVLSVQFFTSTWMLKREVIRACGMFRVGFHIYEDMELLSRVALRGAFAVDTYGGVKMRRVPEEAEALSDQQVKRKLVAVGNECEIYERLRKEPGLTPPELKEVRLRLSDAHYRLAGLLAANGERGKARSLRWQSVKDAPQPRALVRAALGQFGCDGIWKRISAIARSNEGKLRRSELDAAKK